MRLERGKVGVEVVLKHAQTSSAARTARAQGPSLSGPRWRLARPLPDVEGLIGGALIENGGTCGE